VRQVRLLVAQPALDPLLLLRVEQGNPAAQVVVPLRGKAMPPLLAASHQQLVALQVSAAAAIFNKCLIGRQYLR
jgi:hypothetical protein